MTYDRNPWPMRVIFVLIALTVIALSFKMAFAADTYERQTRVSVKDTYQATTSEAISSASWTGLWVAALAGYDMSNTELSLDQFKTAPVGGVRTRTEHTGRAELDGLGGEGFNATLQLGGDYQLGSRIVLGGWAEYAFGGVESSARFGGTGGSARLDVDQNDSYGFFGRAGLVSGDTLFYGAAGWVFTEVDATLHAGGKTERKTFEFDGPAAELGVEHRFAPGIRGKLSARYTWLDEELLASRADGSADYDLKGEPGVWGVKAGIVISTEAMFGSR